MTDFVQTYPYLVYSMPMLGRAAEILFLGPASRRRISFLSAAIAMLFGFLEAVASWFIPQPRTDSANVATVTRETYD